MTWTYKECFNSPCTFLRHNLTKVASSGFPTVALHSLHQGNLPEATSMPAVILSGLWKVHPRVLQKMRMKVFFYMIFSTSIIVPLWPRHVPYSFIFLRFFEYCYAIPKFKPCCDDQRWVRCNGPLKKNNCCFLRNLGCCHFGLWISFSWLKYHLMILLGWTIRIHQLRNFPGFRQLGRYIEDINLLSVLATGESKKCWNSVDPRNAASHPC